MKIVLLVLAAALGAVGARAANDDIRFSVALNATERTAAGLKKLTSDQVAVVDALVRRDTTARTATAESTAPFTQRLTAGERQTAGLGGLTAAEIVQLDTLVARHQAARLARTLLAPPAYLSRSPRIIAEEKKKEREIHGSFSLSYGMGSGGYSEKTGSMVLTMEDPDKRYSISVGYSESHIKGGNGYYYRDPFYELPRATTPDDPRRP
jgi:hypothetical protein